MNISPGLPRDSTATVPEQPSTNAVEPPDDVLVVYATTWCGDCYRTKRFLDRNNVPYRWVDADEVPGAMELVQAINRGHRSVPTLVFPDGSTLSEPSNPELARKLGIEPV
ncbi:MAG TPA: glutaredoxin domain-containing protein [Chloroflexota bacterium]|nr:glutaredoxin domain-containing protein [Chloroflexota bacterium]